MDKFPARFLERINALLPADEVEAYLEHCTEPLPKTIRLKDLEAPIPDGWHLKPTAVPEGFFIDRDNQTEVALGKFKFDVAGDGFKPATARENFRFVCRARQ
jgi:hypothetical protein